MAPASRHADEIFRLPARLVFAFGHDVETGKAKPGGDRIDQGGDPAERARLVEREDINDEGGCDAEIDDVGKRIHLRAEFGSRLHQPRHAPVNTVEEGGEQHHGDGEFVTILESQPDAGQPGADRQNGDEVRKDEPERDFAQTWAAGGIIRPIGLERRKRRFHIAFQSFLKQFQQNCAAFTSVKAEPL